MLDSTFKTKYGQFTKDGRAYVIQRPDTPKPWINVIANERYGLVISQAGGGFSWADHSTLSVLTRWEMDLVRDHWGKFIYLRDEETGALWSAAPQPVLAPAEDYSCVHGIGYTTFRQTVHEIASEWTLTVPPFEKNFNQYHPTMEIWRVRLHNRSSRKRHLSVCSHFMWCLGAAPDVKREFHRLFIESHWNPDAGLITARKHLWDVPNEKQGPVNTDWPAIAFHALWIPGKGVPANLKAVGDHSLFIGRHGDWKNPAWFNSSKQSSGGFGRHSDSIAAIHSRIELAQDETVELAFVLGAADTKEEIKKACHPFQQEGGVDALLQQVAQSWAVHLDAVQVETPDPAFNLLNNTWLTYQTLSARLRGRTGYWQQSGAYGFRDQLQDSQVYLPHAPDLCLKQIQLHARHQFCSGKVYHWWHPLSEVGLKTEMTDDMLWLPFVLSSYLKETADFDSLEIKESFIDDATPASLWEHGRRSIELALSRFSPRGLPLIGEGDWNDGLNACGRAGKGESIWLAHFLYLILSEWAELASLRGEKSQAKEWKTKADQISRTVNDIGWDGKWYLRATTDSGDLLGSQTCREGKIFLNPQTWSIIADTADKKRAQQVMDAVEENLLLDYGPLLLTPAYSTPNAQLGYLTRYAPGSRENGGLYTHAGAWAIQAACKLERADTAWTMFTRISPPNRGMNPDHYAVEPYVTSGNVDGPESPCFGQGGWSWYTGSSAWLRRICLEWMIGVRPTFRGLLLSPCLPSHWEKVRIKRPFREDLFDITLQKPEGAIGGHYEFTVDGEPHPPEAPIQASGQRQHRRVVGTWIRKSEEMLCQNK